MAKKHSGLMTKILATLGALCVAGGITFSVLWCVPSIHDSIWQPQTETDAGADNTEDTTNAENTETK